VGTPPNAIIFASGKLTILEMARAGFIVNLLAAALIVAAVYYLVPPVFDIQLNVVPAGFSL
jgi:sodium-dependent dicarboxylate transporter 2/3/5